jgi:hypothetical protein
MATDFSSSRDRIKNALTPAVMDALWGCGADSGKPARDGDLDVFPSPPLVVLSMPYVGALT